MAEETPTTPAPAAEPPKADPLAKPATATASPLGQPIKRPVVGGAGALKPGLKLPPKPGLAPGLKLPPKPVSPLKTVSAASPLKPGLKMPAAPALKSGLKLPTKPVIRKPGSGLSPVKPLAPKPAAPAAAAPAPAPTPAPAPAPAPTPAPAAPAAVAPAPAPAAPVAAAPAPAPAPAPTPAPAAVAPAPAPAPAAAPAAKPVAVAGDALTTLKTVTRNLKSLTSPIPQQAILHKTGIIADPGAAPTEAQKQAAKSKTSRISLSTAVGAAPVKNDGAPMKTIRIKRPVDLPVGGPGTVKTATAQIVAPPSTAKTATARIVAPPPAVTEKEPSAATASVSATQRKTLKIARPGLSPVRPAGKFGIKKPGAAPAAPAAAPAAAAAADAPVADIPDIPDIPQMPVNVPAFSTSTASSDTVADVPAFVATLGLLVQAAACVAMGALMWFLYQDCQIPIF